MEGTSSWSRRMVALILIVFLLGNAPTIHAENTSDEFTVDGRLQMITLSAGEAYQQTLQVEQGMVVSVNVGCSFCEVELDTGDTIFTSSSSATYRVTESGSVTLPLSQPWMRLSTLPSLLKMIISKPTSVLKVNSHRRFKLCTSPSIVSICIVAISSQSRGSIIQHSVLIQAESWNQSKSTMHSKWRRMKRSNWHLHASDSFDSDFYHQRSNEVTHDRWIDSS